MQEGGMKIEKKRLAVWASMIAGLGTGIFLKPVLLPSGFYGMHGMGIFWELALAGFGIGFAFIAFALLTRHSRKKETPLAAAPKKNIELETNMNCIERNIGATTDKVSEITGHFPKIVNC
jgi:hypothetical protein